MSKVSQMVDTQERVYVRQDEAARTPKASSKKAPRCRPRKNMDMHSLESDIHPRCECCGERIDVKMCASDAYANLCSRCAAREPRQ